MLSFQAHTGVVIQNVLFKAVMLDMAFSFLLKPSAAAIGDRSISRLQLCFSIR